MNMLSLSAVLGILVLVFQDGRLQGLLSYTSQGALDATQPIFLAAVAFGLATDYGVFLLSRIKEARDSGRLGLRGRRRRARANRANRHGPGGPVRGRDRSIRHVQARVHQGARTRRRASRADRRLDHPRAAGAVPDGTARFVELVGTETAAAIARPDRCARERTEGNGGPRPVARVTHPHRPRPLLNQVRSDEPSAPRMGRRPRWRGTACTSLAAPARAMRAPSRRASSFRRPGSRRRPAAGRCRSRGWWPWA